MTEKEIVLETIKALPDDCSLEEIAERIEFMGGGAERSRSIGQRRRHSSRRSQKTVSLMAYKLIWSPAARDDLHDITVFISRDDSDRAMSFGYELADNPPDVSPRKPCEGEGSGPLSTPELMMCRELLLEQI